MLVLEAIFWTFCITCSTRSSFYSSVKFEVKGARISKFMMKIRCSFIIKVKPKACLVYDEELVTHSQKHCHKVNQGYWPIFNSSLKILKESDFSQVFFLQNHISHKSIFNFFIEGTHIIQFLYQLWQYLHTLLM